MPAIPDQFPISLRAWPTKDDKATTLPSLISRINVERGSFRNVTEESLKEEIEKAEAGIEVDQEDDKSEDEAEEEPDRLKELMTSRQEILGQLDQAHNASMLALDFISLLLSKDTPVQASLSISAALRDAVPLGTLGADKVKESRVSEAQRLDTRRVAKGWKIQSIDSSVDSILASATRLEKEIENETKYWEQILSVDQNGWAICALPQEKHTLGVRFGFLDAAPAFRHRSLAALRRNQDGTVFLDQGISDNTPKQLRVRIETNGVITGQLALTPAAPADASIGDLILEARNSIFEEELWQELNREARILTNQGVRSTGDQLFCPMSATKRIILDLVNLEDSSDDMSMNESREDDSTAEMISLALHLLLSFAHRQNLRRRSQHPTPLSSRPPPNHAYSLLRPILTRLYHHSNVSTITSFLSSLSATLQSTGLTTEPYTFTSDSLAQQQSQSHSQNQSGTPHKSLAEEIIESLVSHILVEFSIPFTSSPNTEPQSLTLKLRTTIYPIETRYNLVLSGPVADVCKPPPNPSSAEEVKTFILWAAGCATARSFVDPRAGLDDDTDPVVDVDGADTDAHIKVEPGTEAEADTAAEKQNHNDNTADEETQDEQQPGPGPKPKPVPPRTPGLRNWHATNNATVLRKYFNGESQGRELHFTFRILEPSQAQQQAEKAQAQETQAQNVNLEIRSKVIRSEAMEVLLLRRRRRRGGDVARIGTGDEDDNGTDVDDNEKIYVFSGDSSPAEHDTVEKIVDEAGRWTGGLVLDLDGDGDGEQQLGLGGGDVGLVGGTNPAGSGAGNAEGAAEGEGEEDDLFGENDHGDGIANPHDHQGNAGDLGMEDEMEMDMEIGSD